MHLYALTLQKASTINHAIHGNFSGSKQQEIVISRGKIIELLRPDPNTGKVFPLLAMEMFGVVRDLIAFRLTGGSKGMYHFPEAHSYKCNLLVFGTCSCRLTSNFILHVDCIPLFFLHM